jgi:pimeloyl-ACP methyl ester carboxylesterase
MNGQSLAIRTIIYNDDPSKKTLLMAHGYCMASVYFSRILPALAEHYRIVLFDNLGWGLNSRTDEVGDALESPEKAEKYIVEWW